MVRNFRRQLAGRTPRPHWVTRWIAQHKDTIRAGYLTPINKAKKKADSALYYSLYFKLLGCKIKEYNIQPGDTYNIDKKGFLIGFL